MFDPDEILLTLLVMVVVVVVMTLLPIVVVFIFSLIDKSFPSLMTFNPLFLAFCSSVLFQVIFEVLFSFLFPLILLLPKIPVVVFSFLCSDKFTAFGKGDFCSLFPLFFGDTPILIFPFFLYELKFPSDIRFNDFLGTPKFLNMKSLIVSFWIFSTMFSWTNDLNFSYKS